MHNNESTTKLQNNEAEIKSSHRSIAAFHNQFLCGVWQVCSLKTFAQTTYLVDRQWPSVVPSQRSDVVHGVAFCC